MDENSLAFLGTEIHCKHGFCAAAGFYPHKWSWMIRMGKSLCISRLTHESFFFLFKGQLIFDLVFDSEVWIVISVGV
jgi:hypothetical protein